MGFRAWVFALAVASIVCMSARLESLHTAAAPVLAPDIAVCMEGKTDHINASTLECCAPASESLARPFQIDRIPRALLKVRRPAHKLSAAEAERLATAYELMRALPETDPRSFGQQANIHCAYCNEFYTQPNSTVPLQIHGSWLFFSFHRWYVYFHERILATLLNDTSFSLPFWNYDHPSGSSLPTIFAEYPSLMHQSREASHLPPAVADIDAISRGKRDRSIDDQLMVNRAAFHWVMVSGATTQYRFFGHPYRANDYQMPGPGTAETMPHNSVHSWTGDSTNHYQDMGNFATAARDPIFYAHHTSIDRLWDVWKNISSHNNDIDDPDYLDSEFAFYDENAQLVTVTVRDSLDSAKLGYSYEEVENLWLTEVTVSRLSSGAAQLTEMDVLCRVGEDLTQPCSLRIAREEVWRAGEAALAGSTEESLIIEGIHVPEDSTPGQFNVFVNWPGATEATPLNCTEFAGAFSTLVPTSSAALRVGLSSILSDLELMAEECVVVTIVPIAVNSSSGLSFSTISILNEGLVSVVREAYNTQ